MSEENELDVGLVIRTEPAGGERVRQDTRITIVVSGGPQQIVDPGERDRRLGRRRDPAALQSSSTGSTSSPSPQQDAEIPAGIVISDPTRSRARLVDRGSTVTLIVSSGPGQVTVPPVVGLTEAAGPQQPRRPTISRRRVEYRALQPGDPNDGLVVSQSVAPGTAVDRGTVVALVVGRATAPVTTTTTTTTTTTLPPETTVPPTTPLPP